jgi:hypothetical protein
MAKLMGPCRGNRGQIFNLDILAIFPRQSWLSSRWIFFFNRIFYKSALSLYDVLR